MTPTSGRTTFAAGPVALAVAALATIVAIRSGSPEIVFAAAASGAVVWLALWRTSDLPILFAAAAYQWLEVSVKPIESGILGVPLNDLAEYGGDLRRAALFGLTGVAALAVGMRLGSGAPEAKRFANLRTTLRGWGERPVLTICFGAIVLGHVFDVASHYTQVLQQILLAFSGVRFAGLFTLTVWSLSTRRAVGYLVLAIVVEVILGMTGFFADFRSPLMVLFVALLAVLTSTSVAPIKARHVVATIVVGVLAVAAASYWSEIKPAYRSFLNQGTGEQVANQPFTQRLGYLARSAAGMGENQFVDGFNRFVDRLSYIDFLALTMAHVPDYTPHEHGARLGQTLVHIVTPRILFPDKAPAPNDTEITAHYTGLPLSVNDSTSISIGYLGELYIDFGVLGSTAIIFLIGLLAGLGYRILRDRWQTPLILNYAVCAMVVVPLSEFGTALIKFGGSVVTTLAAAYVLQLLALPAVASCLDRQRARRAAPTA